MTSTTKFYCHIRVFDRTIQDLTVFVWELEPLDRRKRTAREWIEECIKEDPADLFTDLDIHGYGGWEAVFTATIHGHEVGPDREHDEYIELGNWRTQQLPSEMFE